MQEVDKNTTYKHLRIYTDGGSRGNPGPSASGYVIYANAADKPIESGGEYLGVTTNNQAEYQAVKLALERSAKYLPESLDFFLDSELVVKQLNGEYKIRNRDLWPIHQEIKKLASGFKRVSFNHVPRENNRAADEQVNIILDRYLK